MKRAFASCECCRMTYRNPTCTELGFPSARFSELGFPNARTFGETPKVRTRENSNRQTRGFEPWWFEPRYLPLCVTYHALPRHASMVKDVLPRTKRVTLGHSSQACANSGEWPKIILSAGNYLSSAHMGSPAPGDQGHDP